MKYATVGNYDHTKVKYEGNFGVSKTIPDQSMTVREIVDRFAKGLPISGSISQPIYEGDSPILPPDFSRLDIVEQRSIIDALKKRVSVAQSELAKKQRDTAIAKRKEQFDKAVDEAAKKRGEQPQN